MTFGNIIAIILIVGFIALSAWQVYLLIRDIKRRKKAKSDNKEDTIK